MEKLEQEDEEVYKRQFSAYIQQGVTSDSVRVDVDRFSPCFDIVVFLILLDGRHVQEGPRSYSSRSVNEEEREGGDAEEME